MPRLSAGRFRLHDSISHNVRASLLALVVAWSWAGVAWADARTAQDDLRAGIQAFRADELPRARMLFLRAAQAGLENPRLFYNLGVVHYRLGDPDKARVYFERAAQFELTRQISQYNLGRCAQALGELAQAQVWYGRAADGEDPRVADLARRAGSALEPSLRQPWSLVARISGGFDSAVVGLVDQVTSLPTDEADLLHEVQAVADYQGEERPWGHLVGRLSAYHLGYDSVYEANVQSLGGRMRWQRDWTPRRRTTASFASAQEWLDGQAYQLRHALELGLSHALGGARLHHESQLEWLNSQSSAANGIEGLRADVATSVLRRIGPGLGLVRLSGQYNRRRRDENSPWRMAIELFWRSPQFGPWYWAPGLQWRESHFPDDILPREQRVRLQLRGGSPISPSWESRVEVQYEHNRSADAAREYEHMRLLISLVWSKG